ncbi:MAG: hypothetical protein Q4F66_03330 [Clostridium sp.]|nr:hypothetical protein [Clostridium sp.]
MKRKIIKFDDYINKTVNEERKINNLINYLQIKILEERYNADIIIQELYNKLNEMPAIGILMKRLEGEENLNYYFKELLVDKVLNEVILGEYKKEDEDKSDNQESEADSISLHSNTVKDEDAGKEDYAYNSILDSEVEDEYYNGNRRSDIDTGNEDADKRISDSDTEEDHDEEELRREYVKIVRTDILNDLILKYAPKETEFIDDEKFRERFYNSISNNFLFDMCDDAKSVYFRLRNDEFLFEEFSENIIKEYTDEIKSCSECPDIVSAVTGKIEFIEKNNIYVCDYLGNYNNFTVKIISNNPEEVESMLPNIEKIVANIAEINYSVNNDEKTDEDFSENDSKSEETKELFEAVSLISEDLKNLISINIWPDGEVFMIYLEIEKEESKIGVLTFNSHEELEKLNLL